MGAEVCRFDYINFRRCWSPTNNINQHNFSFIINSGYLFNGKH
jgi:hypothetical protein